MCRVAAFSVLVSALAIVGCGEAKLATVPAGGKVMFKKSTPAAGALVVFHPVDDAFERKIGGKPFATVKDDGSFKLTTKEQDDGAPEGEYNVTVDWQKKSTAKMSLTGEGGGAAGSMLNPKYGNPKATVFKFTVKKGDKNEFLIEVD